ncbi:MAG: hypothetical protein C4K47_06735 [Candidatus Thorarchaeota archaeon]|nr:MAG: hypothetical protein C4K47_06735 [Candidatus Thorarchaeota archaeon]
MAGGTKSGAIALFGGIPSLSEKNTDEIKRLIGQIQSGLVEIFDQMRELRRRLGLPVEEGKTDSVAPIVPLFSEVPGSPSADSRESVASSPTSPPRMAQAIGVSSPAAVSRAPEPEAPKADTISSLAIHKTGTLDNPPGKPNEHAQAVSATVARVLDPIAHEIRTGEAPADVIAEYLQAARDYLITKDRPSPKVARDMDVVDKFLRARGKKGIRPEERDNILKRIHRWSIMLSQPENVP